MSEPEIPEAIQDPDDAHEDWRHHPHTVALRRTAKEARYEHFENLRRKCAESSDPAVRAAYIAYEHATHTLRMLTGQEGG